MNYRGIEVNGRGYSIEDDLEWSSKKCNCEYKGECNYKSYDYKSRTYKCPLTLRGHCCKHIVTAENDEKDKMLKIINTGIVNHLDRSSLDALATKKELDKKDAPIICFYERLSKESAKKSDFAIISLDSKKSLNIRVCGKDQFEGLSTFLSFDRKFLIVSSYLKHANMAEYSFYKLLLSASPEKSKVEGFTISSFYKNGDCKDPDSIESRINLAFEDRRLFLTKDSDWNDELIGTIMNYYKLNRTNTNITEQTVFKDISDNNMFHYLKDYQGIDQNYVDCLEDKLYEKSYYDIDNWYIDYSSPDELGIIMDKYPELLGNNFVGLKYYTDFLDKFKSEIMYSKMEYKNEAEVTAFDMYYRYLRFYVNIIEYIKFCKKINLNKRIKGKYFVELKKMADFFDEMKENSAFAEWDKFFKSIFRINNRALNNQVGNSFDEPLISKQSIMIVESI